MTLAPIFIIGLAGAFGWRSTFVVTGLLGLLWLVPWLVLYRPAKTHRWLTEQERQWILSDEDKPAQAAASEKGWTWLQAFGRVEVCACYSGECFLIRSVLYQNWYPKYWSARAASPRKASASPGPVPGGRRGQPVWRLDCRPLHQAWTLPGAGAPVHDVGLRAVHALSPLVALAPSASLSLALASILSFCHLAWLVNIGALVLDVVPSARWPRSSASSPRGVLWEQSP